MTDTHNTIIGYYPELPSDKVIVREGFSGYEAGDVFQEADDTDARVIFAINASYPNIGGFYLNRRILAIIGEVFDSFKWHTAFEEMLGWPPNPECLIATERLDTIDTDWTYFLLNENAEMIGVIRLWTYMGLCAEDPLYSEENYILDIVMPKQMKDAFIDACTRALTKENVSVGKHDPVEPVNTRKETLLHRMLCFFKKM